MNASITAKPDEQRADFKCRGYVIIRQLFSPHEIATLRDAFMDEASNGPVPKLSEGGDYDASDPLKFYPRMLQPHRFADKRVGRLAMQYMLDQRLYPPLKAFMEDEPVAVQSMFYFKPPGARGQALHQDNLYLRVKPGTCCAAWVAVDPADQENGGLVVVPGTQDMELICPEPADITQSFSGHHVPIPEGMSAEPVNLQAGDVLFFNGSVVHGSYPNTSPTRFRRSFICHYAPMHAKELATYYADHLTFDGGEVTFADATGGGPCGEFKPTGPH